MWKPLLHLFLNSIHFSISSPSSISSIALIYLLMWLEATILGFARPTWQHLSQGRWRPCRRPMAKYDHTPVQRPYIDGQCLRELIQLGYQSSGVTVNIQLNVPSNKGTYSHSNLVQSNILVLRYQNSFLLCLRLISTCSTNLIIFNSSSYLT